MGSMNSLQAIYSKILGKIKLWRNPLPYSPNVGHYCDAPLNADLRGPSPPSPPVHAIASTAANFLFKEIPVKVYPVW